MPEHDLIGAIVFNHDVRAHPLDVVNADAVEEGKLLDVVCECDLLNLVAQRRVKEVTLGELLASVLRQRQPLPQMPQDALLNLSWHVAELHRVAQVLLDLFKFLAMALYLHDLD